MTTKEGIINTLLVAAGVVAWMTLPMSVLSEKAPVFTTLLKILGTVCTVAGCIRFYQAFKNQ